MQRGIVYYNGIKAGVLEYNTDGYVFAYAEEYFHNNAMPAVSLTLPKTQQQHTSNR